MRAHACVLTCRQIAAFGSGGVCWLPLHDCRRKDRPAHNLNNADIVHVKVLWILRHDCRRCLRNQIRCSRCECSKSVARCTHYPAWTTAHATHAARRYHRFLAASAIGYAAPCVRVPGGGGGVPMKSSRPYCFAAMTGRNASTSSFLSMIDLSTVKHFSPALAAAHSRPTAQSTAVRTQGTTHTCACSVAKTHARTLRPTAVSSLSTDCALFPRQK